LKITDYAEKKDIKVAIENNVLSKYNLVNGRNKLLLMCEAWEFEKLLQEINSDNLGVLLDLGHLKVTANLLKFNANNFIENLKNKIFLVHIHENDGELDEHKCIKKGDWSLKVVQKYFKILDTPVVLECKCNSKKELDNSLKILKSYNEDAF
jgi:sugar phosphate isomerase/epimerase